MACRMLWLPTAGSVLGGFSTGCEGGGCVPRRELLEACSQGAVNVGVHTHFGLTPPHHVHSLAVHTYRLCPTAYCLQQLVVVAMIASVGLIRIYPPPCSGALQGPLQHLPLTVRLQAPPIARAIPGGSRPPPPGCLQPIPALSNPHLVPTCGSLPLRLPFPAHTNTHLCSSGWRPW